MQLRDRFFIAIFCIIMVLFQGCKNTTVLQFSENIQTAKENQTFVAEYSVQVDPKSQLVISSAWVEKAWYYDNTFGSKSIDDERVLYFEIKNYNDIESIVRKLRIEVNPSSISNFQIPIGGFRISGEKIWCDFSLNNNRDLPMEILVDAFKIENKDDKSYLTTIKFTLKH